MRNGSDRQEDHVGSYQRVLVGTDGSASSYKAVDRAAGIAREAGAQLIIVTAYKPLSHREQLDAADQLKDASYKLAGSTPAEEVLRDAAARVAGSGLDIATCAVQGEPVDVLVRTAQDRNVDLIVVGNRGMGSLTGRLLGSVPSVAAHRSPCDILIVATT